MSVYSDSRLAGQALVALMAANARYWTGVTPVVRCELRHWAARARMIEDPELRALALFKLRHEAFNAEVAAVAATLAPRAHRAQAVRAIVALELLYDYLDGLTERPLADPLGDGERLFAAFVGAVDPSAGLPGDAYLNEFAGVVRSAVARLPAGEAIAETARHCALRAAQAQIRMHATPTLGEEQLAEWARVQAGGGRRSRDAEPMWREYLAGAASSVLALHALIAAAADPRTSAEDARRIDAAYMSIAAVVTLLDGTVDHARDTRAGELSYAGLYEDPRLLAQALTHAAREATERAMELPAGAHHLMMLAGAIAYWSSAPGASNELAKPVLANLHGELRMLVLPPLLVMRAWRAAKWTRRRWRGPGSRDGGGPPRTMRSAARRGLRPSPPRGA